MTWWRPAAACVEAVLLLILVLLWYDSLRERPGWTLRRATKRAAFGLILVPIGLVAVLLVPLWLGLILIAIPALAIIAMALAS